MERRSTPVSTSQDSTSTEQQQIHDTQTSLESAAVSAERARTDATSGSEVDGRLEALQTRVDELSARVRLLEKQISAPRDGIKWLFALMFFILLAVTWRLLSATR